MRIYLDVCCYNRPFDNQTQIEVRLETEAKLHIQSCIRKKTFSMVWSYMLDFENNNSPYEEKKKAIALWKDIADKHCPSSDDVLSAGREIMKFGIKERDALHIACAIKHGCEYFITTDKGLLNKSLANIKIINPIDFIRKTEVLQ